MITTNISIKNQVTIPTYILHLLGVKGGDKILMEFEEKQLLIKPAGKSVVDSLIGSLSVPASKKNIPFEKVLKQTKQKISINIAKI